MGVFDLFSGTARSPEDYVFLWVTNEGAAEITANSILSLQRAGVSGPEHIIVAVLDEATADVIGRLVGDIEIVLLPDFAGWRELALDVDREYREFGTQSFRKICLSRYVVIEDILKNRRRPVVCADGDIVFLRNPAEYLCSLQPAFRKHVLTQNDRRADHQSDEWGRQYTPGKRPGNSVVCSGFTAWQPVAHHWNLAREVIRMQLAQTEVMCDQDAFNALSREYSRSIMLLRQDLFPNGSLVFREEFLARKNIEPREFDWSDAYIVHANWILGMDAKVRALKEAGLWLL